MSVTLYTEEEIRLGDTMRIEAEIRDWPAFGADAGALVNPDSHIGKLYKADGTQEGADYTSPVNVSTGKFYQAIDIPSDGVVGDWSFEWSAIKSAKAWTFKIYFEVVA